MNRTEMLIEITRLQLEDRYPNCTSLEWDNVQRCFWVESYGFSSFGVWSLTDPEEGIFNLAMKYKVSINHRSKNVTINKNSSITNVYFNTGKDAIDAILKCILISKNRYIEDN